MVTVGRVSEFQNPDRLPLRCTQRDRLKIPHYFCLTAYVAWFITPHFPDRLVSDAFICTIDTWLAWSDRLRPALSSRTGHRGALSPLLCTSVLTLALPLPPSRISTATRGVALWRSIVVFSHVRQPRRGTFPFTAKSNTRSAPEASTVACGTVNSFR